MSLVAPETMPYLLFFCALAGTAALAYYRTYVASTVVYSDAFKAFRRSFLFVFVTMMMSDWLQGPYVYALYDSYGFSKGQIGQLFIVGFGSSMLFGTIVGGFADKYGRRMNCLLFALLYGFSCITKHFNDFTILMVGRLLGGVATSILMSAFETWMIHEHRALGFPDDWLSSTFSLMTSLGNGLIAILAGLVASVLAANFGYVAPFDASLVLLIVGAIFIATQWRENYGEHESVDGGHGHSTSGHFDNFTKAWRLLLTNERVLLLGLIQSAFESSMYVFVFMWTPALESSLTAAGLSSRTLPHGLVFACFMVCIMIGSKLFEIMIRATPVEGFTRWMFIIAAAALATPILTQHHIVQLLAFCAFEGCCGVYFPSAGTMRSKYIPEEVRSTVMNIFRVGVNVIVVVTLVNIEFMAASTVFSMTVGMLLVAAAAQHRLFSITDKGPKYTAVKNDDPSEAESSRQTASEGEPTN